MDNEHEAIIAEVYGELCGLTGTLTADFYKAYLAGCEKAKLEPWGRKKASQRAASMYGLRVVMLPVFAER